MTVSVGICAFNEEGNISKLLESTLEQEVVTVEIVEIVVISSASTDKTDSIVEEFCKIDPRIKLVREEERRGKASAVNMFLGMAIGEICVIQSADTVSTPSTIEEMCLPIVEDPKIGAVGGNPKPVPGGSFFLDFASSFIWHLHSRVSAKHPKLGEISAHRNIIDSMPIDATSDDTYLEYAITKKGMGLAFAPKAVIFNKGPSNFKEYIEQRTRWRGAQIKLGMDTGYYSSSSKQFLVNAEVAKYCLLRPWTIPLVFPLCLIELYCIRRSSRMLRRDPNSFNVWNSLTSTKKM